MFRVRKFENAHLERLYSLKQLHQYAALLVHVLCIFTAALLLVALNHLVNPDLILLWSTVFAACALSLNIWLNVASPNNQYSVIVASGYWIFGSTLCVVLAGGQHGILPCIIAIFTMFTIFPFDLIYTVGATLLLSLTQITVFILTISTVQHRIILEQLIATILVHLWTNFIGIYIYATRNRLCRAAFLNARNALTSQQDVAQQNAKMSVLLSSSLPPHVITSVQSQISVNVPKIYVEHYIQATVLYAKVYGLQTILNKISLHDSARLLNEFSNRIDLLTKKYNFIRIQSDAIVILAGVPQSYEDQYTLRLCYFAKDLISIYRSFCDATSADIQLQIGIGSGTISSGIIGARKWHYDIIGVAYDTAKQLESKAQLNCIIVSDEVNRFVERDFVTERFDFNCWTVLHQRSSRSHSGFSSTFLFSNAQRRFSLVAFPQAISRLLQSCAVINAATNAADCALNGCYTNGNFVLKTTNLRGRRKRKNVEMTNEKVGSVVTSFDSDDDFFLLDESNNTVSSGNIDNVKLINFVTMRFTDSQLEANYYSQIDRWFIPALAINILFLIVYGIYQMLVLPRLLITFASIIVAMCMLFIILLMLYVNYFESFGQFITRTSAGHTITIVLIIVVIFICGIFSCDSNPTNQTCREVYYSTISCALWMLTTAVFVRFRSIQLLFSLVVAILFYSIQVFGTHSKLYLHFSIESGWRVEFDVIIGLLTLALIIYLQSRRNERMIRIDYLSILKTLEENHQLERLEYLNEQIIFNALPSHIAHNYMSRSDPYQHLCQSVGVLSAKFGQSKDWQGEFGFDKLNRIVFEIDQLLDKYIGVEKVRTSHCVYTCAVGVLPEIVGKSVNDTPYTISDLLASLTYFALKLKEIANNEGLDIAIGIDCGLALSLVIGQDRPRYELIGMPCIRSNQLMTFAFASTAYVSKNTYGNASHYQRQNKEYFEKVEEPQWQIVASEEIFLALRPRQNDTSLFWFDEKNPITIAPGLIGYALLKTQKVRHSVVHSDLFSNAALNHQVKVDAINQNNCIDQNIIQNRQLCQENENKLNKKKVNNLYNQLSSVQYSLRQYEHQIQQPKIIEIAKPNTSLNTIVLPNSSSMTTSNANKFVENAGIPIINIPMRHSLNVTSKLTTLEEQQKRYTVAIPQSFIEIKNSAQNNLGSLPSLPSSAISETDFDEIDERVAAEACVRECVAQQPEKLSQCFLETGNENMTQSTILPVDVDNVSFDLPLDLQALTNDKRLSRCFSESDENKFDFQMNENSDNKNAKHLAKRNPFEMFASMNSSFSSELFSVDLSVESDSEIEWITPEMIAANKDKNLNSNIKSSNYSAISNNAFLLKPKVSNSMHRNPMHEQNNSKLFKRQFSEQFLERSGSGLSSKMRHKRLRPSRNGPKLPSWFNSSSRTSFGSQLSVSHSKKGSISAIDRLNAAASRVDKMLQELASVEGDYLNEKMYGFFDCAPFPTTSASGSTNALVEFGRGKAVVKRESSNACHTDYDNAESEDFYSDSELMNHYKNNNNKMTEKTVENLNNNNCSLAHKLKQAFLGYDNINNLPKTKSKIGHSQSQLPPLAPNSGIKNSMTKNIGKNTTVVGTAYEADIDSNCSSLASSLMFLNAQNKKFSLNNNEYTKCSGKWKSVYSIGYENEYEFASEGDYYDSSEYDISKAKIEINSPKNLNILKKNNKQLSQQLGAFDPTLFANSNIDQNNDLKFIAMDADIEIDNENCVSSIAEINPHIFVQSKTDYKNSNRDLAVQQTAGLKRSKSRKRDEELILDARGQVNKLSKDIRRNFGDFQLASFSDIDA